MQCYSSSFFSSAHAVFEDSSRSFIPALEHEIFSAFWKWSIELMNW